MRLQGRNPHLAPLINPQYLSDYDDVDLLIKGINLVKKLVETEEFRAFGAQFNTNQFPGNKIHFNLFDFLKLVLYRVRTT